MAAWQAAGEQGSAPPGATATNPYNSGTAEWAGKVSNAVPVGGGAIESVLAPGAGHQRAASSLQDLANQFYSAGKYEMDESQGARDTAMGYYNPATSQYDSMYGAGGYMAGPGTGEQAFGAMGNDFLNNTQSRDAYAYGSGALSNNNPTEQLYGMNYSQLTGPGAMERFAEQSLNTDTDPYYQQLQKQQSAQIDASMNGRGAYNSGAALAAQALGNSNLAAQQYHQQAEIQAQGQQAQGQRLGMGLNYTQGIGSQNYNNVMGIGSLAHGAGADALAGQNAYYDAAGDAQNWGQGRMQSGFQNAYSLGQGMGNTYTQGTQQGFNNYNSLLSRGADLSGAAATHAVAADDKNQEGAMGLVKKVASL